MADSPWIAYVLPACLGLVGGVVGSLVAPWVQWAVEKRRNAFEYRRALIKDWREAVECFDYASGSIGDTAAYSTIRPHLGSEVRKKVESDRLVIVPGGRGQHPIKHMLLDEIARIEREWDLIGRKLI